MVTKRSAKSRSPSVWSRRSSSPTMRRRRSRICWRSWRRRGLARSVSVPSSSSGWRSLWRSSVSGGSSRARRPISPATGSTARPHAARRGPASRAGISRASSAPSSTLPSASLRASTGRMSGMPSSGGAPSAPSARRASPVREIADSTAATSADGVALSARSRPMDVHVSVARRDRTASHSVPRSQIRPAPTLCLARFRSGGAEVPESGVLPGLIGRPLPALGLLASRQGLALAPHTGLLVVLPLLELGQEPRLLTLLLEALQYALEGLVGLDDDLDHALSPSAPPPDRWI